ncbi:hypothetical protein PYCCODRAFT_1438482 [Trametes coccinea BRFM310]|uniref:Uncharacterized protein n=1 Tax=Trametes coccinea (strain BRFM310) TaxID=1353009 RepID=A0A1Y2IHA1_TRAC3|nr:hypothetical protein PYCCODRAFT_1438482 [Trametes coccinea BRFM310]
MAYARGLANRNTQASGALSVDQPNSTSDAHPAPSPRSKQTVLPPERRTQTSQADTEPALWSYPYPPDAEPYYGQHRPQSPSFYNTLVRQCIDRPVHAIQRTVTAFEHRWAMRAVRAEALLDAHTKHREELSTFSASMEERRARDLAALNERFSQELAKHRLMIWIVLGFVAFMVMAVLYLILRTCSPISSPSRSGWGSTHFTIPILSPFASVIEHETSAVNVPLVAVLLAAAGICAFLWSRCGFRR